MVPVQGQIVPGGLQPRREGKSGSRIHPGPVATSRHNAHRGGRGRVGDHYSAVSWACYSTGTPAMPQAGPTPARGSGVSQREGRCPQGAAGAWRKARRESCVPGQALPAPCAFVPRLRLEPCRRNSRAQPHPTGSRDRPWVLGTLGGSASSPATDWLLNLIPNPRGLQHSTPETVPQRWGPRHPGALLTLTGLLSFLRCFS